MNTEQFMIDYFKDTDTVTVSANELQQILRDKAKLQRNLEKSEKHRQYIADKVRTLERQLLSMECLRPVHVKLDVKG